MRAAQKSKLNEEPRKPHGASGSSAVVDAMPQAMRSLADVPATVPELPSAYLVRDEDLTLLRAALAAEDGASGTTLTSKKQQNKVGAHGMVSIGHLWELVLFLAGPSLE